MGRLKSIFMDKVYSHSMDKIGVRRNLKNVFFSYNHKGSILSLSTGSKRLKDYSEEVKLKVNKHTFIKSVLEDQKDVAQENFKPKKVVIDFSSPNIAKPFHVGHLRSTIIGNFIANINKHFHNNVIKINYLGDWGTQFGLLQYGLQQKNISISELTNNPIKKFYEVYVEANKLSLLDANVQNQAKKFFSDIELGRTNLENWKTIRKITVQELGRIYKRLGIEFDDYHWESDYNGEAIKDLIGRLEEENIITTDSLGKKVAAYNNRDVTVIKSDNSTLYLSRDIAALVDRHKRYNFDKMLYVVDNAQTDHFAAVFNIVGRYNKDIVKGCEHIKFGRIKGMSTRSGNVIFLNDILDEAKQRMYDKQQRSKNTRSAANNEETCDILGTTAVLINDLKQRRQKDYVFEWEKALQSEGDSGIKLQYLHCRLWSLENNSGVSLPKLCDVQCLTEDVIGDVVAEIAKFDDILSRALIENEACIIVNYLFRLARHVNRMFNEVRVKNVDRDLGSQRLLVFHRARLVIKTALEILGVKPLCEM